MTSETSGRRRSRLSLRTLMIAVAVFAFGLAPLSWVIRRVERQRELVLRAALEAQRARVLGQRARAEALRAAYLASLRAASSREGAGAVDPATRPGTPGGDAGRGGLWAGLAVNHALFRRGETQALTLEFTLVNDGDRVIPPNLSDCRIVVNGEALDGSGAILDSGPRVDTYVALPPHDHLQLVRSLGESFKEPGVYRVRWEGEGFRSPEVVFRVLPERSR